MKVVARRLSASLPRMNLSGVRRWRGLGRASYIPSSDWQRIPRKARQQMAADYRKRVEEEMGAECEESN